jgi:hypothetical protein
MARGRKKADPFDDAFNTAWSKQASGVQVNIMDMSKIFNECRASVAAGVSLEDAVNVCIVKYRKN